MHVFGLGDDNSHLGLGSYPKFVLELEDLMKRCDVSINLWF